MLRFRRLMISNSSSPQSLLFRAKTRITHETSDNPHHLTSLPSQSTTYRHLDFYQIGNKGAIEKERARLNDEMNRGYFADISEMKEHGGKVGMASKTIIPATSAVKFPTFEVNYPNGASLKLPIIYPEKGDKSGKMAVAGPSLLCISFRASAEGMINSWTTPFLKTFSASKDIHMFESRLYALKGYGHQLDDKMGLEVSIIESGFLSFTPVKKLLLWIMRKPKTEVENNAVQKQNVYAFGDHYYFRKELKILNLLTGYVFLLDRYGRIRWQGFGSASEEEVASLLSCTSSLLEEN
ncbi:hypothetical protein GIB67_005736 [Kingdonia uniflora]|uniref:AT1G08220-like protein n=1 Tax=Kingdonia uniflora TaxID=39325 RepID=A0A7J7KVL4_9MAGN|nr:hypothetical protein GIB67_005736 [Kingdonia uniflora]